MRFQGAVYRAHHPRWAFAPTSGDGAARYGGRFNPLGMAALYTSLRMETAWLEAQQGFPFKAQPMTVCAYAVDCMDVADLTDPAVYASLDVQGGDSDCAWEDLANHGQVPNSWSMTRRLHAAGVAAILVPSYAPGATPLDRNLVFWRWSDVRPYQVTAIDDHGRLPRSTASWP